MSRWMSKGMKSCVINARKSGAQSLDLLVPNPPNFAVFEKPRGELENPLDVHRVGDA